MSAAIPPEVFGPPPRRYASLALSDLSNVRVLACPDGCDAERVPCKAATVTRHGNEIHYTPHVELCSRARARL